LGAKRLQEASTHYFFEFIDGNTGAVLPFSNVSSSWIDSLVDEIHVERWHKMDEKRDRTVRSHYEVKSALNGRCRGRF